MFQKRIVEKYLSNISKDLLNEKYALYCSIFANKEKQENIRNSKEEQYQEGFIRDLFCSVLGYTIKPEPNYNILTELKNDTKTSSKKSDGAIVINNEVKAVIELKGTDTQDLDKVAFQAFSYKNHHERCNYVIVSNFERLRLYVETQIEYKEFNLFNLSKNDFDFLYLLLQLENITNDIPLKLKHETLSEEKEITNNFYADYSTFKRALFEDLTENNPEIDKLLLFKKTQKLLDRILFVMFCEDKNLLPANSIIGLINDYKQLKEMSYYKPLYDVFKNFFNKIDKGFKHDNDKSKDVFAYNGGLFKPDETLDNVKIGDDVLYIHSQKLANYDFQSQISVDILGRIFENSLTEIEEIQNEIENEKNGIKAENNNIGKRKKDGVFYTPEYITKYIVENTIGKLCEEKKNELKINDKEYTYDKKYQKKTIDELDDRLNKYREWLLSLKILDCACGSGAFLNAALRELRKEHNLIDKFWSKIHKNELNFSQIDNTILENNLYGVDINEESIEISKLSLWLNTATKDRKLTTLNDKIKCGNSLIDDESIAGEKAFKWEKEFPDVFEKGGFDVVISNPPYVNMANIQDEKERKFYQSHYKTVKNKCDLYSIFTEKAKHLLRDNGKLGFIFPNSWLGIESFSLFRDFLAKDVKVSRLVELPEKVFADAIVKTMLCFYDNTKPSIDDVIEIYKCYDNQQFHSKGFVLPYKQIIENPNTSFSFEKTIALNKVETIPLKDIVSFSLGIKTSDDKRFIFEEKKDEDCFLILRGRNIKRWSKPENNEYIWYKPELITEKVGGRPRIKENFTVDKKIVIQDIAQEINATIDKEKYLCNDTINIIYEINDSYLMEYILTLLNSKLVNVWFKKIYPSGLHIKTNQLEIIPIPVISLEQQKPFVEIAEKMMALNEDLQKKANRFIDRVKETYNLEKTTQTIENFYNFSFADLVKELSKQKIKLSMKQKDELEDYFSEYVKDISALNESIEKTDKEINSLVYSLYNLTPDEIKVIEG